MTEQNQPVDPTEPTGSAADAQAVPDQSGTAPVGGDEGMPPTPAEVLEEESAPADTVEGEVDTAGTEADAAAETELHPDTVLAEERLADLQRLQAEYVNYKRRVDRDRAEIQIRAAHDVLETLLPVLDEIELARQHGDLTDGPFRAIAEKLEQQLDKHGLERVGAKGEPFDPNVHEALMHAEWDPADEALPKDAVSTTIVTVLQPGYRAGERVLRPARVAVADPQ